MKHRIWRRLVPYRPAADARGLHVGSGHERLRGWINVDLQTLPEVDRALDVTRGLPYGPHRFIFAEHFLEHLPVSDALGFLVECRRVLGEEGVVRLSTPNLDWVWRHVYSPGAPDAEREHGAILANRAFYGWQHQFLWNRPLLERALVAVGLGGGVRWCRWGESAHSELRGIERHETYPDTPEVPHVLIAEARRGDERPEQLERLRADLERHFLRFRSC